MTIKNAIAKLTKAGFKVEHKDRRYYAEKHTDITKNGMLTGIRAVTYDDGLELRYRQDQGELDGAWSGPSKVWAFANGTFGRDNIRRESAIDALRAVYEFAVSMGEGKKGY